MMNLVSYGLIISQSFIEIVKNHFQHDRTTHIKVKYHAIREIDKSKEISQEYCSLKIQIEDNKTKTLLEIKFEVLRSKLGISKKY